MNKELFNELVKEDWDSLNQIISNENYESDEFMNAVCNLEFSLFCLLQEKTR